MHWDPETGDAVFDFGADESLQINILTDSSCKELPFVGPIVRDAIADADEMRVQECVDAVRRYNLSDPPRRGEIVASLDDLRTHIEEWCPPQFARQLIEAEQ